MERERMVSIDQLPGFLSQGIGMDQFERMLQLRERVAPSCNPPVALNNARNTAQHSATQHTAQHTAMPKPCP